VIKVPTAGIEIEATLTVPPIAGRTTPWQALNALYKSDTLELFAGVPTPPAMEVVAKLQCWRAVLTLDIIAEISLQRIVFPIVNAIINLQILFFYETCKFIKARGKYRYDHTALILN
jgi:hypothetical protein